MRFDNEAVGSAGPVAGIELVGRFTRQGTELAPVHLAAQVVHHAQGNVVVVVEAETDVGKIDRRYGVGVEQFEAALLADAELVVARDQLGIKKENGHDEGSIGIATRNALLEGPPPAKEKRKSREAPQRESLGIAQVDQPIGVVVRHTVIAQVSQVEAVLSLAIHHVDHERVVGCGTAAQRVLVTRLLARVGIKERELLDDGRARRPLQWKLAHRKALLEDRARGIGNRAIGRRGVEPDVVLAVGLGGAGIGPRALSKVHVYAIDVKTAPRQAQRSLKPDAVLGNISQIGLDNLTAAGACYGCRVHGTTQEATAGFAPPEEQKAGRIAVNVLPCEGEGKAILTFVVGRIDGPVARYALGDLAAFACKLGMSRSDDTHRLFGRRLHRPQQVSLLPLYSSQV